MKELIYISGPITGVPGGNREAFNAEAARLRALGFEVINPVEVKVPDGAVWSDYMRADIKLLMDCTAIVMLPGWMRSKGANIEHDLARALGMTILIAPGRSPFTNKPARTDWAAA